MRGAPWTKQQLAQLRMLREVQKLPYPQIAACFPGRNANGCSQAYLKMISREAGREIKRAVRAQEIGTRRPLTGIAELARLTANAPPPAPAASRIATPISRLVADAELRDRIAERGLTAGILGDPPPGRSALDLKRAGKPT
jgi:hypothetical protein